jgi:hypothetical protein
MAFAIRPAACLAILTLATGGIASAQNKSLDDLRRQCDSVCQTTDAPWGTIPWQTDLLKAQHLAVQGQKPIFIWAMDGHPLGCT